MAEPTDKIQKHIKSLPQEPLKLKGKYLSAVGRRKTSTAQVRLYKSGFGEIIINDKKFDKYFTEENLRTIVMQPLKLTGQLNQLNFSIIVHGGGRIGQAEAIRHGISRTLIQLNIELRPALKAKGLVTRDARKKERKKPGLKKARRAPQWSKR